MTLKGLAMKDNVLSNIEMICKAYPNLDITQLGLTVLHLAAIRAKMGHENASSTIKDYIHEEQLSNGVSMCVDLLARELFAIRRSKIDIDYWKKGNKGEFRDE